MKKLALIAAAVAVAPSLAFTAPVFADSPGQLSNSADFYKVKNETKGSAYGSEATATCGDVVKYSVMIANSEFGMLSNVTVKTTLAGSTTVSATNDENKTTSVSGNVTVNAVKGDLVYVAGSTKNLKSDGTFIKTLADGITTSGVNKGSLNGSTAEFVQFQAKVVCETTPVTPTTPETPKTPEAPKPAAPAVIAATGPASAIATMTGLSALAAGIGYAVQRRRNILG
jgi:hypothetical protein